MAAPLIAGLPPGLELGAAYIVRVNALDATTGNVVTGVNVSNVTIEAQDLSGASDQVTLEPVENVVLLPIAEGQEAAPA